MALKNSWKTGCACAEDLPGETEGAEEAREGEAETRVDSVGVHGGVAEEVFDGFHEQVQASDRRHVKRQRHRREGRRE
ncbi:hypothetical protein D8674_008863 [Pyrus ussuriensis x Pyrus communis]|uniref:Uncharacterized protein n=1 Tax=Pyrus ussuriensis x Pyrus communis TaxID=2448454 RepID=A0A5N5I6Y5_9ROSA|nr:hypothetical protein D8674_008863 [Pyrus ussuriensis x Pyrus communis]